MTMSLLALLLPCQVVRVPQVPYSSAVYHIHSPERFLEAHGLAGRGVRITETFKPVGAGRDNVIAFNLRTERGRMSGRLFSDEASSSHIALLDEGDRMFLLARLSVEADGISGVSIRVQHRLPVPHGGEDVRQRVRSAILAGERGGRAEDPNLLLYRRRVLRPPGHTI
jgi:hypothetical protein